MNLAHPESPTRRSPASFRFWQYHSSQLFLASLLVVVPLASTAADYDCSAGAGGAIVEYKVSAAQGSKCGYPEFVSLGLPRVNYYGHQKTIGTNNYDEDITITSTDGELVQVGGYPSYCSIWATEGGTYEFHEHNTEYASLDEHTDKPSCAQTSWWAGGAVFERRVKDTRLLSKSCSGWVPCQPIYEGRRTNEMTTTGTISQLDTGWFRIDSTHFFDHVYYSDGCGAGPWQQDYNETSTNNVQMPGPGSVKSLTPDTMEYEYNPPVDHASGSKVVKLTDPYTDGELYTNILSKIPGEYPGTWYIPDGSGYDIFNWIAYSLIDADHVDAQDWNLSGAVLQKMKYRFTVSGAEPGHRYNVTWDLVTWNMSTGDTTVQTCGPIPVDDSGISAEQEVEPPEWDQSQDGGYVITFVDNVRVSAASPAAVAAPGSGPGLETESGCGSCGSTASRASERVMAARFALGKSGRESSAGSLWVSIDKPSSALYTPASLTHSGVGPGVERVFLSNVLRQVKAPQTFVDIVTNSSSAYEMRFYLPSQFSSSTNALGLYTAIGSPSPFVTWKVENPDALGSSNQVRITETRGADQKTYNWAYAPGTRTWSADSPAALSRVDVASSFVTTNQIYTRTVTVSAGKPGGAVESKVRKIYRRNLSSAPSAVSEMLIEETLDPDVNPKTTSYTYHAGYVPVGSWRPIRTVINPDGSWIYYTYDANRRVQATYEGIGDLPAPGPEDYEPGTSNTRFTTYDYAPSVVYGSDDDGTLEPNAPRRTVVTSAQIETSRSYMVRLPGERRDIRCRTAGASWDSSDNLVTVTRYYTTGPNTNKVQSVLQPDGTLTRYDYAQGADGSQTNTVWSGQSSGGTSVSDGIKTVTVEGSLGETLIQTASDIRTGAVLSRDVYGDFDEFRRARSVTHLDGTVELTAYACCGVERVTDRDGVSTVYGYDEMKRLTSTTTQGITTLNTLDSAGRIIQTTRHADGAPTVTLSQSAYDASGELSAETNAFGGVTQYFRSVDSTTGGQVRTTIYPDGGTRIESHYLDGTLKSVAGTAARGVRYEYGAEQDGQMRPYTLEVKLNTNGTDSSEWSRTCRDMLGNTVEAVYSDATSGESGDNPRETYFFNAANQLWKQTDPDGLTTLTVYNLKGEQAYSVQAISETARAISDYASLASQLSTLIGGTDRITWTTNDVVLSHGVYVRRTRSYVWDRDNVSTPVLVSMSEASTNGSSWQTSYSDGGLALVSQSQTLYGSGTRTVTSVAPDNSYSISLYSTGRLASVTRYNSAGSPIGSTSYSYDPHGRQQAVTDARNGSTTYAYNDADLMESVSSPDPGTPGGAPQITRTYYNKMLQATNVVQSDGASVFTEYHPTGELKKSWGARTYPVEYTYDYAGRMQTMTTWQNFATSAGAAVTTWNYEPATGRLASKRYQDGTGPDYTYTTGGRLKTRSWARVGTGAQRVLTTYTYGFDDAVQGNEHGEMLQVVYSNDPQGTAGITYTYDRLGRQVSAVQGSTTVTYRRSLSGQLLSESYAGGPLSGLTVTNRYDHFLRRTNVATLNAQQTALNSVAFGYDTASRLSLARSGTLGIGYEYLANSPMVEHLYYTNNNVRRMITTKAYDRLNRLTSIASVNAQGAALSSHAYLYNAANQRARATMADGSYWLYQYDSLGQVKSGKKYWADGSPVAGQQFEYGFDDIGNRTATKAGGDENGANLRSASYTPNLLNQYTSRTVLGAVDIMGVSFATNTVTVNGQAAYRKGEYFRKELPIANTAGPVWTNITVSATGQGSTNGHAFLPRTPEQFWYDTDGNLTNDGRWKYTWDAENRLVRMISGTTTGPQQRLDFGYDSQGRRTTRKVWNNTAGSGTPALDERFVYDGWNLAAELNATNNAVVRGYVWGLDLSGSMQGAGGVGGLLAVADPSNGTNFCCFDGNGNVSVLVSATNASAMAQYEYGPFGEVIRATGPVAKANPFRFSTKYQDDETDLIYYGYRYYSASTGRWLQGDPSGMLGGVPLYASVGNNPISRSDLLGLWDYRVHQYRTLEWLQELGVNQFASWGVALGNQFIDTKYPVYNLHFGNPVVIISDANWSWHFNRSPEGMLDSRLKHRDEELAKAQERCNWAAGNDEPLIAAEYLGYALHPYQDVFAHGDFNRKKEAPTITGQSPTENLHYMHNYDEYGWFPAGYWWAFPKPDEPSLDANGVDGVPTFLSGCMFLGDVLSNGDTTYYARFHPGSERINATRRVTRELVSGFQEYVRANSKPCGECQKAFLGRN